MESNSNSNSADKIREGEGDSLIPYSPLRDGIGVRVLDLRTGRRGVVERIVETQTECLDPLIRWSDGAELSIGYHSIFLDREEDL